MSARSLAPRLASAVLLLVPACNEPPPVDDGSTMPVTGVFDTGDDSTSGTTAPDDPSADTTASGSSGASSTGDGPCEPVTVSVSHSTQPAGVIFLVDNSPTMGEEAAEISARLNMFATLLSAQIDTTLVMISAYPEDDPQGVCVDPPLGNGGCPASDNNPPGYIHIDLPVTPLNAISHLFVTYDQWADALPMGAKRHIVVVSDGDTGVAVGDFQESFTMLDPELNASFRFHVSVAHGDCEAGTTPGNNYRAHAMASGGFAHDLCTQDYGQFFQGLTGRILNDVGDRCRWEVPEPPEGVTFHPDYIELLIDADGLLTSFPRVESEDQCNAAATGWYWENPVTTDVMLACPGTCELLLDFAVVASSVRFGCPPEGADGSTSG